MEEEYDTIVPQETEQNSEEFKESCIESFKTIKGVGQSVAEKLYDAQFYALIDIAACPVGEFMERTGISKASAEKIINGARALADLGKIELASELLKTEDPIRLTTGSKSFDELIGGGYPLKLITEIFGENGSGKSQTCFTATVLATRPIEEGGLDSYVVYVDTEGTFRAHRIAEIAKSRGYDVNETLSKIFVIRANTSSHQVVLMDEIKKIASQHPVRLLIVDSIISHFRAEYTGRGVLAERQQIIAKYMSDLKAFAINNDACVLVSNQVAARPDAFFGDPNNVVGGNVVGHASAYIIKVRKGKMGKRVFGLIKSPDLPSGECVTVVNEKGVADA